MIQSLQDYKYYLEQDKLALGIPDNVKRPRLEQMMCGAGSGCFARESTLLIVRMACFGKYTKSGLDSVFIGVA